MIEYVVEHNPDDRILRKASQILRLGGLVCFPTETNWIIVADPFQRNGIDKLYHIRHVDNTKHFTILCENFKMAQEIACISDQAFRLVKKMIPGPYTFIFEAQKKITKHLKASKTDHQVGIRFSPSNLCQKILKTHGDVLICSHLTHEMMELDDETIQIYSAQIEDYYHNQIELIIDPGEYQFIGQTSIIDFSNDEITIIREGSGDLSLLR